MIVDVAVLPCAVRQPEQKVCLVIDVLRASTSLVSMFEAGALRVIVASTPEEALARAARDRENVFVCGERGGLPPEGFDAGNSPYELARVGYGRRDVVYSTSNGTRAIESVRNARAVMVGAFINAEAAAGALLREAQRLQCDIELVCAGDDEGVSIGLEDLVCAGYIIELLQSEGLERRLPEDLEAVGRRSIALDESAVAVNRLLASYLAETGAQAVNHHMLMRVFEECRNGRELRRRGFERDLQMCAAVGTSRIVPVLVRDADGLVLVPEATPHL